MWNNEKYYVSCYFISYDIFLISVLFPAETLYVFCYAFPVLFPAEIYTCYAKVKREITL